MKASFPTKNVNYLHKKINVYLRTANQWLFKTPERSLEQAYKAALAIKAIEDEHFGGNPISADSTIHSDSVMSYLQADLEKHLSTAKLRLVEFKASRSVLGISDSALLEKLSSIDEVVAKYTPEESTSSALVPGSQVVKTSSNKVNGQSDSSTEDGTNVETVFDKTGVLPRSIGRTINRIKTDLDPRAEEKIVKKFHSSRAKTRIAIRFLVMLILVPLLTQQLSKHFLVDPIVNHMRGEKEPQVFLNHEMKEEALHELQSFEEELKFNNIIHIAPHLSPEALEEQVEHKATELVEKFQSKSSSAISNVFADLLAVIAFVVLIVTSKSEIIVLKSFMDNIVYGLSDSAKAFIIILFTDMFVGFHSPHGWEVMLEGLAGHLGVAANENMIFLFIATFPVILDTIFKYWIFRYLSQMSPSALATVRNMNE